MKFASRRSDGIIRASVLKLMSPPPGAYQRLSGLSPWYTCNSCAHIKVSTYAQGLSESEEEGTPHGCGGLP